MRVRRNGVSRIVSIGTVLVMVAVVAYGFLSVGVTTSTTSTSSKTSTSTAAGTPLSTIASSSISNSPLVTFNADAYTAEIQALLNGFTLATSIPVAPTHPAGSFALARQITSGSQVDVFIPVALPAAAPSNLGSFSSNWAIGFASDQMVLAYSNTTLSSSAGASVVTAFQNAAMTNSTSDWNTALTALTSGNVQLGISDPNADPAGLRGWLVLEAAGSYYGGGNQASYTAPLLQAKANITGSAAANMVAPLQAGQLQFLFIYKSAAITQHLGYLRLDHVVNLGDPELAASYARFTYSLKTGLNKGAPIILCMTIPSNAPHASEAMQFVQYVVKNSASVVSSYGLKTFAPPLLYNNTATPQFVTQMLSQGLVGSGGSLGQ